MAPGAGGGWTRALGILQQRGLDGRGPGIRMASGSVGEDGGQNVKGSGQSRLAYAGHRHSRQRYEEAPHMPLSTLLAALPCGRLRLRLPCQTCGCRSPGRGCLCRSPFGIAHPPTHLGLKQRIPFYTRRFKGVPIFLLLSSWLH